MRLIDAEKVLEKLEKVMNRSEGSNVSLDYIIGLRAGMTAVKIANVVEVEPVKHGRWIDADGYYTCKPFICSNCNAKVHTCLEGVTCGATKTPFCPCCGAKMDEEDKTDES